MEVNDKTFCAAPWFQIERGQLGKLKSCCEIRHEWTNFDGQTDYEDLEQWLNSDYAKYLRKNLTNGVQLPECKKCWIKEENNTLSLRQTLNNTVSNNKPYNASWLYFYFKNKTNYAHDTLITADISTSNVCNFSCAMCSPESSSKIYALWKKHTSHPFVKVHLDKNSNYFEDINYIYKEGRSYKFLQQILEKKPKHLKLLGGEPLLDERLLEMLEQYQHKSNLNLLFVTNGSVSLNQIKSRLTGYKTLSFVVSLEGVGEIQDYVRRGSNWKELENNLLSYIAVHSNQNLYLHHTLQALTFIHLPKLISWTITHNIPLGIGLLTQPKFLSFSSIPDALLEKICNMFVNYGDVSINRLDGEISTKTTVFDLIDIVKNNFEYSAEDTVKLKEFLDWYDPEQKWKHVLPEWRDVFPDCLSV